MDTTREIPHPKLVLATSFLLFISISSLYLFLSPDLPSQPWDSLRYAFSTESEGISAIWGNHPLGHIIFFSIFNLAKGLGYQGRALPVLQVANSILGGLTIAAFFAILVCIIKASIHHALGFSMILGASYSFWFFAGTGEIYHLSMLFFLLALATQIYEVNLRSRVFPLFSGIFTGLAILSHQLNSALIPVGLALIFLTPHSGDRVKTIKIQQIVLFSGLTFVVTALGYLLLGFIATSSISPARVLGWMQGYFGDPTYGRYLNAEVFRTAWMTFSQAILFSHQDKTQLIRHGTLVFMVWMMLLGLWSNQALDGRKRVILAASALACLMSWPLIFWWETQNPKFWLLTLVPWMILLALAFEAVEIRIRSGPTRSIGPISTVMKIAPFIIGAILLTVNGQTLYDRPDTQRFYEAMDLWMAHSGPEDVLIPAGDLVPHLRYWGNRPNTVFLYRSLQASQNSPDDFYDLRKKLNPALCAQRRVLITPAASEYISDSELSLLGVSREELRSYLEENANKGEILFWYRHLWDGKLLPVYVLKRSANCLD